MSAQADFHIIKLHAQAGTVKSLFNKHQNNDIGPIN